MQHRVSRVPILLAVVAAVFSCLVVLPRIAGSRILNHMRQQPQRRAPDAGRRTAAGATTTPDPKLSPEQVVGIQLEALRQNDTPTKDSGIATAFGFASPGNREATGPLARFIELVKSPAYKPLLNYRSVERSPVVSDEGVAHQRVTVIDAQGKRAVYVFILTRQSEGPCINCWMTDGVVRVPERPQEGVLAKNLDDSRAATPAGRRKI